MLGQAVFSICFRTVVDTVSKEMNSDINLLHDDTEVAFRCTFCTETKRIFANCRLLHIKQNWYKDTLSFVS